MIKLSGTNSDGREENSWQWDCGVMKYFQENQWKVLKSKLVIGVFEETPRLIVQ